MGGGSRTTVARQAQRIVLDHVLRTVRDLPERIARDRFDQVACDVWEQSAAADRAGTSGAVLAARLLMRTLRGVPADVAWRAEALREQRDVALRRVRTAPHLLPATGPAFDQTNGLIDFDRPVEERDDDLARLLAQAVASNAVNVGMVGGNL